MKGLLRRKNKNKKLISTHWNISLCNYEQLQYLHSTVGTVCATTVLGSLVNNDAGDVKFFNVQTLSLIHTYNNPILVFNIFFFTFLQSNNSISLRSIEYINIYLSVGFSILQQVSNELDGLDGPATLGSLEFLGLSSATDTTVEVTERNDLLVLSDVLQVAVSLAQLQTLNSNSDFMGVLELYNCLNGFPNDCVIMIVCKTVSYITFFSLFVCFYFWVAVIFLFVKNES